MAVASDAFRVSLVSQSELQIEVLDTKGLKEGDQFALRLGTYLKVSDDDGHSVIVVVREFRIRDQEPSAVMTAPVAPSFLLTTQPIGFLDASGHFRRGGQQIAIPPSRVEIADGSTLRKIFASDSEASLSLGALAHDEAIDVPLDGNRLFGKHVAIVGSTGCGKSCAVSRLLQEGIGPSDEQMSRHVLNNSHVVLFDLHGECAPAFPQARLLSIDNLRLPYWLMNSEELEEMFILSDEMNSHNQVSQFRRAVVENKRRHNPGASKISYDSLLYFSLEEVYRYLCNVNSEVIGKAPKEDGSPILGKSRTRVVRREDFYFSELVEFSEPSRADATKTGAGPFAGEFDRFVLRLRNVLDDERLAFLLRPADSEGRPYKTADLRAIIAGLVGYTDGAKGNMTLIDLSGIPFEVLSLVVSLVSRIVFDVGFNLKKSGALKSGSGEIPFVLVYEEAHLYAPNAPQARYRSVTRSIERIAKEGRKYGVSLVIVSQRPSEIAETVFSQCNNVIAMRLANPTDQNYVRRLLPDAVAGITDGLASLEQREALIVGTAVPVPSIVKVAAIENRPDSHDVRVLTEWRSDWREVPFDGVLQQMMRR